MAGIKREREQSEGRGEKRHQQEPPDATVAQLPKSSEEKAEVKICTNCPKPATLHCLFCADGHDPSTHTLTYYCSVVCQSNHHETHKEVCCMSQTLRQVYNAGHLLQHLFYIFRGAVFRQSVYSVLILDGTEREKEMHIWCKEKKKPFLEFPEWLCATRETKLALLMAMACTEAIALMTELVNEALSGVAHKSFEVHYLLKPNIPHMRTVWHMPHSPRGLTSNDTHEVITIVLPNRKKYIIDLTGAQYGWDENPVTPWETYMEQKVAKILDIQVLGHRREVFSATTDQPVPAKPTADSKPSSSATRTTHPRLDYHAPALKLANELTDLIHEHLFLHPPDPSPTASTLAMTALLNLPRPEFKDYETHLLNSVRRRFRDIVAETEQAEFDRGCAAAAKGEEEARDG